MMTLTIFLIALVFAATANIGINTKCASNDTDPSDQCIDNDTNNHLMQKLWHSIGDTVTTDLQYLKSLASSPKCKDLIESEYLENILYPVIHKNQPFSYGLQNLCPHPNPLQLPQSRHNSKRIAKPSIVNTLRIVYLIIMYKNPLQVIRLISSLNTSMDHFLIHIDKKSSINVTNTLTNYASIHSNIHIMEQHELTWGGYKMIEVELFGMQYAINLSFKFDFLYVLSESDYPLVSTTKIRNFLSKYRGKTIMKRPQILPNDLQYTKMHTACDNKLYYVGTRPTMERQSNVEIYSTTVWVAFSYEFTYYLATDTEIVPEYLSFFENTATCDEKFFPTVLMNSPLCDNYVDINWNEWRIELWPEKNTDASLLPCRLSESNLPFCGRGPIDIKSEHLPILQATPAMFARKFDPTKDEKVLDVIDEWRVKSRGKPKLLKNYKLIKISMNGKCLTFDDQIGGRMGNLFADQCINGDDLQLFMLECTGKIKRRGKCLQSVKQFDGKAMSQCQIRSVLWDDSINTYVSGNECVSMLEPAPKVKENGMNIMMDKCRKDGYIQWFWFDECEIKYANPLLKYLRKKDQNLCIRFCEIEQDRPCVKTCQGNKNMNGFFGSQIRVFLQRN